MFLLYINDTGDDIKSKFRLFADDSFLYLGIDCTDDCNQLQKDRDKLVNWASEWQMKFNASRCHVLGTDHLTSRERRGAMVFFLNKYSDSQCCRKNILILVEEKNNLIQSFCHIT